MTPQRVIVLVALLLCGVAAVLLVTSATSGGGGDVRPRPIAPGRLLGGDLLAPGLRAEVAAQHAGTLRRGEDVHLLLDGPAQRAAVRGLRGHEGAAVALDVRTGRVVVWAGGGRGGHPGRSRVRPGATLEPVIAAAALDARVIGPTTTLDGGRSGPIDVREALVRSSNTAFADVLVRLAPWRVQAALGRVGYGRRPRIDLPARALRASGTPVTEGGTHGAGVEHFRDAEGRFQDPGELQPTTAAQMAANAAAMADGTLPRLRLAYGAPAGPRTRAFGAAAARAVRAAMRRVVTEGTASSLRGLRVPAAAETGTTRRADGRSQASIIALLPAAKPRWAVAVTLAAPRRATGDRAAGPIARDVLAALAGAG